MHRWALSGILVGTLVVTGCAAHQAGPRPFPGAPAPPVAPPPPSAAIPDAPPAETAVTPGAAAPVTTPSEPGTPPPPIVASTSAPWVSPLLTTALALRGTPYRLGGNDPTTGFD